MSNPARLFALFLFFILNRELKDQRKSMAKKVLTLEQKSSESDYTAALELALSSSNEEIRKALENSYTIPPEKRF